jgi:hypothetical protein
MKPGRSASYRFQLWGWILFIFSAVFFIASSIRSGDLLSLIGGLLFLVACIVFITPMLSRSSRFEDD